MHVKPTCAALSSRLICHAAPFMLDTLPDDLPTRKARCTAARVAHSMVLKEEVQNIPDQQARDDKHCPPALQTAN